MMNCTEYRTLLLADPRHPNADMLRHAAGCHECAVFCGQILGFESRLERAFLIDVGPVEVRRAQPFRIRRGLAIAASVLFATCAIGTLWLVAPGESLAAAVVKHMAGEPLAWLRTGEAVSDLKLNAVMSASAVHFKPGVALVTYANSCEFRGHHVPHLVVQTAAGPVTVMLLEREYSLRVTHFNEQGYRGMIVPIRGHGSLAVLEQTPNAKLETLESVAASVLNAIEWAK